MASATPTWRRTTRQFDDHLTTDHHFIVGIVYRPTRSNWPRLMVSACEDEDGIAIVTQLRMGPDDRDRWTVIPNDLMPAELEHLPDDLLVIAAKRLRNRRKADSELDGDDDDD